MSDRKERTVGPPGESSHVHGTNSTDITESKRIGGALGNRTYEEEKTRIGRSAMTMGNSIGAKGISNFNTSILNSNFIDEEGIEDVHFYMVAFY